MTKTLFSSKPFDEFLKDSIKSAESIYPDATEETKQIISDAIHMVRDIYPTCNDEAMLMISEHCLQPSEKLKKLYSRNESLKQIQLPRYHDIS
mmetsp:Transcript_23559/g.27032  ORF Transcript_23559/g.27032 Transcript_23559/m.27032 type:complete len:93 (+) Transcript_23559:533-811(+)